MHTFTISLICTWQEKLSYPVQERRIEHYFDEIILTGDIRECFSTYIFVICDFRM